LLRSDVMSEMRGGDEREELASGRTLALYLPEVRLGVRVFGRREKKGSVGAVTVLFWSFMFLIGLVIGVSL